MPSNLDRSERSFQGCDRSKGCTSLVWLPSLKNGSHFLGNFVRLFFQKEVTARCDTRDGGGHSCAASGFDFRLRRRRIHQSLDSGSLGVL